MTDQLDLVTPPITPAAAPVTPEVPAPTAQPSDIALATLLSGITNESGEPKYKDVPTALQALKASQDFIPQLKNETSDLSAKVIALEAELAKRATVEETIASLNPQTPPVVETPAAIPAANGLTAEDVEALLNNRAAATTAKSNLETVQHALTSRYGDKTNETIEARAKELGMTTKALGTLAGSSPEAALALFGAAAPPSNNQQSLNTATFQRAPDTNELPAKTKNLMQGGSSRQDLAEEMRLIREHVHAKMGVTT